MRFCCACACVDVFRRAALLLGHACSGGQLGGRCLINSPPSFVCLSSVRNPLLHPADTKVWAFNPPGGMVSANLSHALQDFVTSVSICWIVLRRPFAFA